MEEAWPVIVINSMELSMQRDDEQGITCTLIHELAHRLVIGNGIDPPEGNKFIDAHANYYVHRHIYSLFHMISLENEFYSCESLILGDSKKPEK